MTKVLLVNNDSDTWQELINGCQDAGFDVTTIPCRDVKVDSANGYDAVVLSGGWWYDDEVQHLDTYQGELELIKKSELPIVGICLGMQLIQIAHSGQVQLLDKPQHDIQTIQVEPAGQRLLGWPANVRVHKNHTMGAIAVTQGFEVLARSPGHIEIIRHESRPIIGVQFHPEVGSKQDCAAMLRRLISSAQAMRQSLLIEHRPAVDELWCQRLAKASRHTFEIWAYLGTEQQELAKLYDDFAASDFRASPSLSPDASAAAKIRAEKRQLQRLLTDIEAGEVDAVIRSAYVGRINELIANAEIYEAALQGDAERYRQANEQVYGKPSKAVFAAVCRALGGCANKWAGRSKTLLSLAPSAAVFQRQRELHIGAGGFYDLLFRGTTLPSEDITPTQGDRLLRQLLVNLGASGYSIIDATDSHWSIRYGLRAISRPIEYSLGLEGFTSVVGHEIGSHLLERLNGNRQPLRLLGIGLAGYEKGNEGRALLREQVAYETWEDFTSQRRWYDILLRHLAVSLAAGLAGRPQTLAEVFDVVYQLNLQWAKDHDAVDNEAIRQKARQQSWSLVTRALKGTNGKGGAYYKDIVYLEGNIACWRLAARSESAIRLGDAGKVNITNAKHRSLLRGI